jgi:hypothetical protein
VPVVAVVDDHPDFRPDANEVAELFEVRLSYLTDESNFGSHVVARRGLRFRSPHIEYQGRHIWGATRVILADFHQRLCGQSR